MDTNKAYKTELSALEEINEYINFITVHPVYNVADKIGSVQNNLTL